MTSVTMALAMCITGISFLLRPASSNDLINLITVLLATTLVWGANAIMVTRFWCAWRTFRHDA
jgi:hypothetical protein